MVIKAATYILKYPKQTISFLIVCLLFQTVYGQQSFQLIESEGKVTGLAFSKTDFDCQMPKECFEVTIQEQSDAILGKWSETEVAYKFSPFWSFSQELTYRVYFKNELIGKFTPPKMMSSKKLTLQVFPSADTLPQNLLKMYFQFSEPMQEVRSEKYVFMLSAAGDTLSEVFLDLHPELWSVDGSRLTLWVDPGRVKRDLIRNQKMGLPLEKGNTYKLAVSSRWKSRSGSSMTAGFEKQFYVTHDDRVKPALANWKYTVPTKNMREPLLIEFGESLDYALLLEVFSIVDAKGVTVLGRFETNDQQTVTSFIPANAWLPGQYVLIADAKLEDLSGNNLNRLFDVDLKKQGTKSEPKQQFTWLFEVL